MGVLFLVVLLRVVMAVRTQSYLSEGPYETSALRWKHGVPAQHANGRDVMLDFTITFPRDVGGDADVGCPLVFFYSGFEMRMTFYSIYAQKLASWGYVVVQYDAPLFPIIDDRTEVSFFPYILNWVPNQLRHSEIPTNIDDQAVAVGGHSRGGKLASLIAAENSDVSAVFLIDPVDSDGRHAKGKGYPSGVAALQGRGLKMAIAGSSISGSCNPANFDFHRFWNVAADGSWLTVVAHAGHCQFLSAPPARQWILNRICKSGKTTCKKVIDITTPSLIAWLESTFKTKHTNTKTTDESSRLDEFFLWVASEVERGEITFSVKGHEPKEV